MDEKRIKKLIVIEDLVLIIELKPKASSLSDGKLIRTIKRIKEEFIQSESV